MSSLPPAYNTTDTHSLSTFKQNVQRHASSVHTHFARVALQELDFLVELDVVGPQAVQLVLQGLHGLLHGAALLQGGGQSKHTHTHT